MAKFPEPNSEWTRSAGGRRRSRLLRAIVTRVRNLRAERGLAADRAPPARASSFRKDPFRRKCSVTFRSSAISRASSARGDFFEGVNWPERFRDVVADVGLVVDLPKKEISSEDREKLRARDREAARGGGEDSRAAGRRQLPLARSGGRGRENEATARRNLRTSPAPLRQSRRGAGRMSGVADPLEGRSFTHIENVIYLPSTPSTNDVAKTIVEKMLAESEDIRPTIIVAGEQTAGHGRMGRKLDPAARSARGLGHRAVAGRAGARPPAGRAGIALARGLSTAFGLDVPAQVAERPPRQPQEARRHPRRGSRERRRRRLGGRRRRPQRPRHAEGPRCPGAEGRDVARGRRGPRGEARGRRAALGAPRHPRRTARRGREWTRCRRRSRPSRLMRRATR